MAYETGSASDIEDLVDKLHTFATGLSTTPWTEDELDLSANQSTLHLDDCYVTFRWDSTVETDLGLYQSLGWSSSTAAHAMPDDSGNGDTSIPINSGRRVNFESTGPFTAYNFFAGEGDEPYIYVVVEVDAGRFRHFGFGNIKKLGTWDGGEFVYGHVWNQYGADNPAYTQHTFLLGSIYSGTADGATLHVEGIDSQGVNEKWMQFCSRQAPAGTDRAGEDRQVVMGMSRSGMWGYYLLAMRYSSPNAFKPLVTLPILEFRQVDSPDTYIWMGEMVDIALCNMHAFTPGQEVTVGTDTWMVFPWVRKRYEQDDEEESWNAGVAYKKVT